LEHDHFPHASREGYRPGPQNHRLERTSRIATLWTREFGKVRALAKGGRRLKSSFESALDLLTVCSIVFLRKSSGSLDL